MINNKQVCLILEDFLVNFYCSRELFTGLSAFPYKMSYGPATHTYYKYIKFIV